MGAVATAAVPPRLKAGVAAVFVVAPSFNPV